MKYQIKISVLMLALFVVTQFIGLYVVNHYLVEDNDLPYGMDPPEVEKESDFYTSLLPSIIIAFVIAIVILFLLMKFKAELILKIWFFVVVSIALGLTLNSFIPGVKYASIIVLIVTIPVAFFKVFKNNFIIHHIAELFVYPGIAAVFVPLLNIWTMVILLILISCYDMWAVWRSGVMQKMAKYQINKLKVFSGFFVPYASPKVKTKIKKMSKKDLKTKKVGVNLAILGGGDIVFPIITSGVVLKTMGILPALLVILGAAIGLGYLFFAAKKKKFYPAMPFITSGMFLGIILGWLIF